MQKQTTRDRIMWPLLEVRVQWLTDPLSLNYLLLSSPFLRPPFFALEHASITNTLLKQSSNTENNLLSYLLYLLSYLLHILNMMTLFIC